MRIWAFLDWCFFGPASARAGACSAGVCACCATRMRWCVTWPRGEINLRAMSLVYTTLLSLIPLLAFSFAVLKIFGGRRDLEPIVYEFFRPGGRCGGDRAHHARAAVRQPRQQRRGGIGGHGAARLDAAGYHQEGRGQLQLPVARGPAAQPGAPARRIHEPAHRRPGAAGGLRGPVRTQPWRALRCRKWCTCPLLAAPARHGYRPGALRDGHGGSSPHST